jgi:hypothetical protein
VVDESTRFCHDEEKYLDWVRGKDDKVDTEEDEEWKNGQ